jgi:hypothetical protein
MRKRFRPLGVPLTIVGAVAALALFVLSPAAIGGGGKDAVSYYTNSKGNVVQKVGEDEYFEVHGTNLAKTVEVYCWAGKEADDGTGLSGWDTLTDWDYSAASKTLINGDMDPDCDGNNGVGLQSAIMVQFDHTPDTYVIGPSIFVKDEQKD